MPTPYRNVVENWLLFDTVGIFDETTVNFSNPAGWYLNYAAMGGANEVNFFNVRNRRIGLPFNNQDSVDQMPYGFRCSSIGITFFSNSFTQAPAWATDTTFSPEDTVGHIFMNDLPRHAAMVFRVQQDDRLKCHVLFTPGGYGPFGDGYGRGSPSQSVLSTFANGYDHHAGIITQGMPQLSSRWQFPIPIDIPRRATISVKILFNEYARQLLQVLPDQLELFGVDNGADDIVSQVVFAGIQVSLGGQRLVQQRGQLHV